MRSLKRLLKPEILEKKEIEWRDNFISSGKKRPDNSKYAHPKIKEKLNAMSFHKCFYCEVKLLDTPSEVDHFIEVSEKKELSFEWENLYLSCDNCNGKLSNLDIPITNVLDPCKATDSEIESHLLFDKEIITARNGSIIGQETIRKYKLGTDLLDRKRMKKIQEFYELYIDILKKGTEITTQEKEALLSFQQPDKSFSLMFKQLIAKLGI